MTGLAVFDRFGTDGLRARVLAAWAASPSRFREDANAEEDYALGGYRDRVIVELAQNAADAAARASAPGRPVPGRLRLTLAGGVLTAANTGAPLDAAGVEALSTLRASSKRGDAAADGTVGRFGVGFAAVVAVSDAPRISGATGSVSWSRARTVELVRAVPELAGEVEARSGHVPVLRLPFAGPGGGSVAGGDSPVGLAGEAGAAAGPANGTVHGVPDGFTTAVELPLRDDDAIALVRRLLAGCGPALLLALPALTEVEIRVDDATRLLTAEREGDRAVITVDGVPGEWRVAAAGGALDPALLAGRPAEERGQTSWSVRWAVPVVAGPGDAGAVNTGHADAGAGLAGAPTGRPPAGVPAVVHAPTPTDEPLSLPALLLASFPLSPDRRHVAPGPLTDFLLEQAADGYAGLLAALAAGPGLLDLVPGPVGRGELDARLGRAIVARLPGVPFLEAVAAGADNVGGADNAGETGDPGGADDDPEDTLDVGREPGPGPETAAPAGRVRPRDAVLLATDAAGSGLARWLAPVLPNLVAGPARHPAWAVLGVRRLSLAELADTLAALGRPAAWWHGLYAALADVPAAERSELGALPVPLADGRQARGPRGLLLPGPGLANPELLSVLGLRVVHPEAAHPLLARLGAVEATPRGVLEDPATRAAVAASYDKATEAYYDDDGPAQVAEAVLGLVAATDAEPGEYPWLADLALPGDDGDWYPAGELLLPGSALAAVVADDAPFGTVSPELAARHGERALAAAGALASFGLLTTPDVALDDELADLELDGVADWAADTRMRLSAGDADDGDADDGDADDGYAGALPPVAAEFTAVRDLDLVDPARWPQALELLTRPPLRAAVTEPTRVLLADGRYADVPCYTAWWLRRHLVLGGRRPGDLRLPGSDPLLAGLYDEISADADAGFAKLLGRDPATARALGVRASLAELLDEPGGPDELLDRLADVVRPVGRAQLRALWTALAGADRLTTAAVSPPTRVRTITGDVVTVADSGDVLILDAPDLWPLLADQPLVLAPYRHAGRLADLLDLPLASEEIAGPADDDGDPRPVPGVLRDLLPGAPGRYQEHDELTAGGIDVPWRYAEGILHAATAEGLAHGLAWAAGRWEDRHLAAALLTSPEESARLLAEADLNGG